MSRKMTVAQFERSLVGLQGAIPQYAADGDLNLLFDSMYPMYREYLADVQKPLQKIAMYEPVKAALAQSEALAREAKYVEAEDVILEINRALMRASGTWDKMVKRYPPKSAS